MITDIPGKEALMKITQFHTMRTAVQDNAAPASPAEQQRLVEELERSLVGTGVFEDVEVGRTDNIDNLVIAMCTFPADVDEDVVARWLEGLWGTRLSHGFWEAHASLVHADQVELEGATRAGLDGRYLTVHILAQKAAVPAQRTAADQRVAVA
jgi:hypothetical protein